MSKARPLRTGQAPNGSCVMSEDGERYYVSNGKLLKIPSDDVFASWSFTTIFRMPKMLLDTYPKGGTLGFRPGTVVASISDGCFYYISPEGRHKIVGGSFFKESGLSRWTVPIASKKDILLHKEGSEID